MCFPAFDFKKFSWGACPESPLPPPQKMGPPDRLPSTFQKIPALLHKAISLATCLAILLRHKLHEILPSLTYPATHISRNVLLQQSLRKVEVSSTLGKASRNVARNFSHVAQCNTFPATCVATLNGIGQSNCSFVHVRFYSKTKWRLSETSCKKRCPV